MKRNMILIIVVLAIATFLAIAAHIREGYQTVQYTEHANTPEKLPEFQQKDVASIKIDDKHFPPVVLSHEQGYWTVSCDKKKPVIANVGEIVNLMKELSNARLLREMNATPAEEEKLRLSTDPSKPWIARGIEVTLFDKDKKTLLNVTLGLQHTGFDDVADGRFIRYVDAAGKSHIALTSEKFDRCIPMTGAWMVRIGMVLRQCTILNMEYANLTPKRQTVWQVQPGTTNYQIKFPEKYRLTVDDFNNQIKLLNDGFTRDVAPVDAKFTPTNELNVSLSNGLNYKLLMQDDSDEWNMLCKMEIDFNKTQARKLHNETDENFAKRIEQIEKYAKIQKQYTDDKYFVLQPRVIYLLENIPGKPLNLKK